MNTKFNYELKHNKVTITGLTNPNVQPLDLVIPDTITIADEVYPVTIISRHAFIKANIKSVILPKNLRSIKAKAFADNLLTHVTLPEKVKKLIAMHSPTTI